MNEASGLQKLSLAVLLVSFSLVGRAAPAPEQIPDPASLKPPASLQDLAKPTVSLNDLAKPTIFWHDNRWEVYTNNQWTPYSRPQQQPQAQEEEEPANVSPEYPGEIVTNYPDYYPGYSGLGADLFARPPHHHRRHDGTRRRLPPVSVRNPNEPIAGLGDTTIGIGEQNGGIGQTTIGIGQPNGIGQTTIGIGQPQGTLGRANDQIGPDNSSLGRPTIGIGRQPAPPPGSRVIIGRPEQHNYRPNDAIHHEGPRGTRGDDSAGHGHGHD
ncbi:MAG TPA: hypothetical protein VHH88_03250 [Verrucomicrobiae bacterium]|nr:hypothetical protein [Verrucomicrobiae bacterium]